MSKCRTSGIVAASDDSAGEHMCKYVDDITATVFGDLTKQQFLDFDYRVLIYRERGLDQSRQLAYPANRCTRTPNGPPTLLAGTKALNWPGIDFDVPTRPEHRQLRRQGVKAAVLAVSFRAGGHGVVLEKVLRNEAGEPQRRR